MKKIHIESDMVIQSDQGSLKLVSSEAELGLLFDDWNAVSPFFSTYRGSFSDLFKILKLTKYLDQTVSVSIDGKLILQLKDGRIRKWKFFPLLKFFRIWRRSR